MSDTTGQGALNVELPLEDSSPATDAPKEQTVSEYADEHFTDPDEAALRREADLDRQALEMLDAENDPFADEDDSVRLSMEPFNTERVEPDVDNPKLQEAAAFVASVQAGEYKGQVGHDDDLQATKEAEVQMIADGPFLLDAVTGEIVEITMAETWVPDTPERAELLGDWLQELDADCLGIQAQAQAQAEYFARKIAEKKRRADYLITRFSDCLQVFAAGELAGTKKKSWECKSLTLAFRMSRGSIKVSDVDAAVSWAEENAPDAVQVKKSVIVGPLKGMEGDLPECFEIEWPQNKFSIKTRVGEKSDE